MKNYLGKRKMCQIFSKETKRRYMVVSNNCAYERYKGLEVLEHSSFRLMYFSSTGKLILGESKDIDGEWIEVRREILLEEKNETAKTINT